MHEDRALSAFAAMSREHEVRIVLLVEAGPDGMSAGELVGKLCAGSSQMSFGLSHLEQAALVRSHRDGRLMLYAAEVATPSGLIALPPQDCRDRPEICTFAKAQRAVPTNCRDPQTPELSRLISVEPCAGQNLALET